MAPTAISVTNFGCDARVAGPVRQRMRGGLRAPAGHVLWRGGGCFGGVGDAEKGAQGDAWRRSSTPASSPGASASARGPTSLGRAWLYSSWHPPMGAEGTSGLPSPSLRLVSAAAIVGAGSSCGGSPDPRGPPRQTLALDQMFPNPMPSAADQPGLHSRVVLHFHLN